MKSASMGIEAGFINFKFNKSCGNIMLYYPPSLLL